MKLRTFAMERWQSKYENCVEYNLSESGVHPLTVAEIGITTEDLLRFRLGYTQTNGTERFRSLAVSSYSGTTAGNILATNGAAEANFLATLWLMEPGDEAVVVLPNYMQVHGLVESLGGRVVAVWLRPENGWIPDPDEIARNVGSRTKFIAVCNPNNPTGAVFGLELVNAIVKIADKHGCWILADEVYRGAERNGKLTPSFWGHYSRTLVTHSLSKAYGAPGLRIGWVLGPAEVIQELWGMADYTKIAPAGLSDFLGCRILEQRERFLERTRSLLNTNWPVVKNWLDERAGMFEYVEPRAGAIGFLGYKYRISSSDLAERVRIEKSTLIEPGEHFLLESYIRLGYGTEKGYLQAALHRVGELLDSLPHP
jgi:aspartate/methionine/tyrosine aminotransferase